MVKTCLYRIATSQAGLETGYFLARSLPIPELPTFQSFSTRRPQAAGGQARHGYKSCVLLWPRLTAYQANILYELIVEAETTYGQGSGVLFLTLPRVDASAPGMNWIDISGIAILPEFETELQSHGLTYPNVRMTLNNVTVLAEPSTAV